MSNTSHSKVRNLITFILSGLVVVAAIWIFFNRQYTLDVVTNWTYEPSSAVSSIVDRTELTNEGKFIFFATRPEVLEQEAFNKSCPRQEAGSPILGCYTTEDRIYMYNITDAKLDGMKEVTAAHEILHAVWQRTDEAERKRLGGVLKEAYEKVTDDSLRTRMDYYERTEPGEFINELHAILGTEKANLGDELEAYYSKFFDRDKVLALHDNYSKLYTTLSSRADVLFKDMETLGGTIDSKSELYNAAVAVFSKDIEAFNQKAANGGFSSNAQFNSERAALMARSEQLEIDRQSINESIATYNKYYEEYQKIADQLKVLNEGMDSYHTIEQVPPM